MALWLLLKFVTILLSASPLMPDIACHQVIWAAGLTSLPGARALWSPVGLAPPAPGVPPPHAAASIESAIANAASLRIFPSMPLPLDRTRGQSSDQLTLPQYEQGECWYSDHDDTRHDQAPAERFLEPQLRDADLSGAHERLVGDEERPEVLVVRRKEAVDRDRSQGRSRERDDDLAKEAEGARAIHARGVPQLARDLHERLTQQECAEGRGEEGDCEA